MRSLKNILWPDDDYCYHHKMIVARADIEHRFMSVGSEVLRTVVLVSEFDHICWELETSLRGHRSINSSKMKVNGDETLRQSF